MTNFRLTEDEAWAFIAEAHTGIVTTLRRDGRPITQPVWHVVMNRAVFVQTPPTTKKLKRIAHDPRAYFVVESGAAWAELQSVSFEARAAIVEDGAAALAAIEAKYRAFQPPTEQLPEAVRRYYSSRVIVRLDPVGRLNSFNNAALVGS
jgi:PPOX class probable F420-dependent enzyme